MISGSKYPKKKSFNFENRSTGPMVLDKADYNVLFPVEAGFLQPVLPFSKLNVIFSGYCDPEEIFCR